MVDKVGGKPLTKVWEALHPEESGYGGGLVDGEGGRVYLGYHGNAVRKGFLTWQKNHLETPVEVTAISFEADEPLWSHEFGAELDLAPLGAENVYKALQVKPVAQLGKVLLFASNYLPEEWIVFAIHCETGERLWSQLGREPHSWHTRLDQGLAMATVEGAVLWLNALSGDEEQRWELGVEDWDALVDEHGAMIVDGESAFLVSCSLASSGEVWRMPMMPMDNGSLSERLVSDGNRLYLLNPGRLSCVDRHSGTVVWEEEAPAGNQMVLSLVAGILLVQDVHGGETFAYHVENGKKQTSEGWERLLHWTPGPMGMVGTSVEGGLATFSNEESELVFFEKLEGWRLLEVQPESGGTLVGSAVKEEGETLSLVRLESASGTVVEELLLETEEPGILSRSETVTVVTTSLGISVFR